jgi:recombinational DNA repair protein RecR
MGNRSPPFGEGICSCLTDRNFRGGWHFLGGGVAGIDGIAISEENMDDLEAEFENMGDFFRMERWLSCRVEWIVMAFGMLLLCRKFGK